MVDVPHLPKPMTAKSNKKLGSPIIWPVSRSTMDSNSGREWFAYNDHSDDVVVMSGDEITSSRAAAFSLFSRSFCSFNLLRFASRMAFLVILRWNCFILTTPLRSFSTLLTLTPMRSDLTPSSGRAVVWLFPLTTSDTTLVTIFSMRLLMAMAAVTDVVVVVVCDADEEEAEEEYDRGYVNPSMAAYSASCLCCVASLILRKAIEILVNHGQEQQDRHQDDDGNDLSHCHRIHNIFNWSPTWQVWRRWRWRRSVI